MNAEVIAGLDIGNGYVKGKTRISLDGKEFHNGIIDMPSTATYVVNNQATLPKTPNDAYMADLINNLDIDIASQAIGADDAGRIILGKRGIETGGSLLEFNIDNKTPKCNDPLSIMLITGSLAGALVSQYWMENGSLPEETIQANVYMSGALPIEDYLDGKDVYISKLMKSNHIVTIRNFGSPIAVNLHFADVSVMAEGTSAQFAVTDLAEKTHGAFLDDALTIARRSGFPIDEEYTGKMLMKAQNVIGLDIGEGTVNFAVFTNGQVNTETCSSINKGYGTVLQNVVTELRNTDYGPKSRKDLADYMLQNPDDMMPAKRKTYAKLQHTMKQHIDIFVRDVMKEYTSVFDKVGSRTDVIYVYGGGSAGVRDTLYAKLADASRLDGEMLPIIYMDSKFSRNLNRNGLFQMAVNQYHMKTGK